MSFNRIFQSHGKGFLFLLPFVFVYALHDVPGLSDALMVSTEEHPA